MTIWVLGGAINNAGSVVRWASAALGMVTEDVQGEERDAADGRLLQEAGQVPFGSEGLLCLPYLLGERAREVLHGPRAILGPPWAKDHRAALAATVVAASAPRAGTARRSAGTR